MLSRANNYSNSKLRAEALFDQYQAARIWMGICTQNKVRLLLLNYPFTASIMDRQVDIRCATIRLCLYEYINNRAKHLSDLIDQRSEERQGKIRIVKIIDDMIREINNL